MTCSVTSTRTRPSASSARSFAPTGPRASTTRACPSPTPPSTATARRGSSGGESPSSSGALSSPEPSACKTPPSASRTPRRLTVPKADPAPTPHAKRCARTPIRRSRASIAPARSVWRFGRASRPRRRRTNTSSSQRATSTTTRFRRRRPHRRAPTSSQSSGRLPNRCSITCLTARPPRATAARSRRRRTSGSSGARSTRRSSSRVATSSRRTIRPGLCMAEIAWMAAVERLDMLLNDAMYGILFRDINMCRTFIDQYVSRRFIARAGIVINTGEDNYFDDRRRRREGAHGPGQPVHQRSLRPASRPARGTDGPRPRLRD